MDLLKKNSQASDILNLVNAFPLFQEKFQYLYSHSEQVIIFGSYAAGVQHAESDIDILFITHEKAFKTKYLDFVCVAPERLMLKSWLGTELANHVANYGVWVKGDDDWKHKVYISKNALERKKFIILHRLTHLWIKNSSISKPTMLRLFKDVVLDSYRLVHMSEGLPVPPNKILVDRFIKEKRNILNEINKPEHLGKVGHIFFNEIFALFDPERLNIEMKKIFSLDV